MSWVIFSLGSNWTLAYEKRLLFPKASHTTAPPPHPQPPFQTFFDQESVPNLTNCYISDSLCRIFSYVKTTWKCLGCRWRRRVSKLVDEQGGGTCSGLNTWNKSERLQLFVSKMSFCLLYKSVVSNCRRDAVIWLSRSSLTRQPFDVCRQCTHKHTHSPWCLALPSVHE